MVLLSPVPELRDSSKLNDSLYNEDCTFQQLGTYIHSVRDPVHNRVTLVSPPEGLAKGYLSDSSHLAGCKIMCGNENEHFS